MRHWKLVLPDPVQLTLSAYFRGLFSENFLTFLTASSSLPNAKASGSMLRMKKFVNILRCEWEYRAGNYSRAKKLESKIL